MKTRAITLGGAALAGILMMSGAALAQLSPYDTNPTPYERAQTDQLNGDAANNARDDSNANAAANDDYNAARADYDAKLGDYNDQRAAYDRDRARYNRDRFDNARRWDAFYGHTRFRDVVDVPERDLVGIRVSTRGGNTVGRVRDVDTNGYGRVTRVAIGNSDDQISWVNADDVRYDPSTRSMVTDLSRDQIDGMARMRYPRF